MDLVATMIEIDKKRILLLRWQNSTGYGSCYYNDKQEMDLVTMMTKVEKKWIVLLHTTTKETGKDFISTVTEVDRKRIMSL